MCCEVTLTGECANVIPFGAVATSGFGDGSYDVHGAYKDDKLIALKLDFEEQEIDEEEEVADEVEAGVGENNEADDEEDDEADDEEDDEADDEEDEEDDEEDMPAWARIGLACC